MFSKRTIGGAHTQSFVGILNDNRYLKTVFTFKNYALCNHATMQTQSIHPTFAGKSGVRNIFAARPTFKR
jgi:hypothetical protein